MCSTTANGRRKKQQLGIERSRSKRRKTHSKKAKLPKRKNQPFGFCFSADSVEVTLLLAAGAAAGAAAALACDTASRTSSRARKREAARNMVKRERSERASERVSLWRRFSSSLFGGQPRPSLPLSLQNFPPFCFLSFHEASSTKKQRERQGKDQNSPAVDYLLPFAFSSLLFDLDSTSGPRSFFL